MPDKIKVETELEFLAALEDGDAVTQQALSRRVAVSVGLVNAMVRRSVSKGYLKVREAPYKRYAYYLTPKGFSEKSRLVVEYLSSSLSFFREARQEYSDLMARIRGAGYQTVVLAGAGELCEIAILAAGDSDTKILAVYDAKTNRETVQSIRVLRELEATLDENRHIAVVVTESTDPHGLYDQLVTECGDDRVFAPKFLRISSREKTKKESVVPLVDEVEQ